MTDLENDGPNSIEWKCRSCKMTDLIQALSRNPMSNVERQATYA